MHRALSRSFWVPEDWRRYVAVALFVVTSQRFEADVCLSQSLLPLISLLLDNFQEKIRMAQKDAICYTDLRTLTVSMSVVLEAIRNRTNELKGE